MELDIRIYQRVDGTYTNNSVTIPASTTAKTSVSMEIDEDADMVFFRLQHVLGTLDKHVVFYTDDWSLEEVTQ